MRVGLDPERGLLSLYRAEQSLGPAAEEIHGRRANPASWPGAVLAGRNGGRSLKGFQHLSRAAGTLSALPRGTSIIAKGWKLHSEVGVAPGQAERRSEEEGSRNCLSGGLKQRDGGRRRPKGKGRLQLETEPSRRRLNLAGTSRSSRRGFLCLGRRRRRHLFFFLLRRRLAMDRKGGAGVKKEKERARDAYDPKEGASPVCLRTATQYWLGKRGGEFRPEDAAIGSRALKGGEKPTGGDVLRSAEEPPRKARTEEKKCSPLPPPSHFLCSGGLLHFADWMAIPGAVGEIEAGEGGSGSRFFFWLSRDAELALFLHDDGQGVRQTRTYRVLIGKRSF